MLRREWYSGIEDPVRRREMLDEGMGHIEGQLKLVRRRREEIEGLEEELNEKRELVQQRMRELGGKAVKQ